MYLYVYVCIYIYIYIYVCVCVCIYMCTYDTANQYRENIRSRPISTGNDDEYGHDRADPLLEQPGFRLDFGFRISGFGFRVSGFEFRNSGLWLWDKGQELK